MFNKIIKYLFSIILFVALTAANEVNNSLVNPEVLTNSDQKVNLPPDGQAWEIPTAPGTDQPSFGTQVGTWTLGMGGTYQGSGITWRQDSGRFYLMAQRKAVYSFKPESVTTTFRQEKWLFQTVTGTYDLPFGIAWDADSQCFWISHIATMNTSSWLYRYYWKASADSWVWRGLPRDTWNVASGTIAWTGGMVKNYDRGYFWVLPVATTPDDKVQKWDFDTKTKIGAQSVSFGSYTHRGVAWIPYDSNYVITCGWYSPYLVKRDSNGTALQQITTYYGYADCEFWVPESPNGDDTAFVFIIYSDGSNTLVKVSTGMKWSQLYTPVANDVGTRNILSPTGSLDSANTITPTASIKNFGTTNASDFWTRFWIFRATDSVIVYRDSIFTSRLNIGIEDTLTFTPFTLNIPRGNYVVKCSTMLFGDNFPRNDAKFNTLPLIIHDVGVMGIVNPPIVANYGDWIQPQAWARNWGTVSENFWAHFYIDPSYHESTFVVNLPTAPAESTQRLLTFTAWQAGPPGNRVGKCTTALAVDAIKTNDFKVRGCRVVVQNDVGITQIVNPPDTTYKGDMKPKIKLQNFGSEEQAPDCIFHGYDSTGAEVYNDTASTTLIVGAIVDLEFDKYWTLDSGNYRCFAERYNPPDQFPGNDTMSKAFFVKPTFVDFGIDQINSPPASIMKGTIPVSVTVHNFSLISVPFFDVMFRIMDSAATTELYNDTAQATSIGPNATQLLVFNPFVCTIPGWYHGYAEILTPDANGNNDTMSIFFHVIAGIPNTWVKMADIAFGEKPVSKGGCLAYFPDSNWVYGLKGNNKPAFGYYNVASNIWTALADMPFALDKQKKPKAGAAMVLAGKYLYIPKGGNRLEFWRYGVPGADSLGWKQLPDVPAGGKKVKGGTVLAPVKLNDTDYIFMAKGSKTNEAYLFNPATNLWGTQLSGVPLFDKSTSGSGFNETLVYAITYDKGTKTNTVFLGNLKTNTWAKAADVPLIGTTAKKKKIKEGSALTNDGTQFYMFKGGNVKEFFDYAPGESVKPRLDIPLTTKKGTKGGAALAFGNGYVWAFPGNKLNEFWQYTPLLPAPAAYIPTSSSEGVMGNKVATGAFKLTIAPNPAINVTAIRYSLPVAGPVTINLYDVTGALVKSHSISSPTKEGAFLVDKLPAGVYIVRFNSGEIRVTRKIVLEK